MSSPDHYTLTALPRPLTTPSSEALPPPTLTPNPFNSEPSTLGTIANALPSHNRFAAVVRSHLPGRPDLTTNSTPLTSSALEYSSPMSIPATPSPAPTHTKIKEEERSTPATASNTTTISTPNLNSSRTTSNPPKPAHLDYLTDAEYQERVAHINHMRTTLAPTMKKSLVLTQERAQLRVKKEMARNHQGHNGKLEEVAKTLGEVQQLLRGLSIELDRAVVMESVEGGSGSGEVNGKGKEGVEEELGRGGGALDVGKVSEVGEGLERGMGLIAKALRGLGR